MKEEIYFVSTIVAPTFITKVDEKYKKLLRACIIIKRGAFIEYYCQFSFIYNNKMIKIIYSLFTNLKGQQNFKK